MTTSSLFTRFASLLVLPVLAACTTVDPHSRTPEDWAARLVTSSATELVKSDASIEARRALLALRSRAVPALSETVRDTSIPPSNRLLAVGTLGDIGADAAPAVPAILQFIEETDGDRRAHDIFALAALRRIGPGAELAVPFLIERLERGTKSDVLLMMTLRGIGPAASDAVPVLAKRLDSENDHHRLHARAALRSILSLDVDDAP